MISRRRFVKTVAAATGALTMPSDGTGAAAGSDPADLTLILLADLHSGYAYTAQLLHSVREIVRQSEGGAPVHIIINGDIFEGGNCLAARSHGAIDLALVKELVNLAPVLVNIGNHDSDLFDPAEFVAHIRAKGADVITNLIDTRTGQPYSAPVGQFEAAGGRIVTVGAVGTPSLWTYPEKYRAFYQVPDPAAYAREKLGPMFEDSDLRLALVHSRFQDDRAVLPFAGKPGIVYGGHEHLRFSRHGENTLHLQSGAWTSGFAVVTVRFTGNHGAEMKVRDVLLDRHGPGDEPLAALIEKERAQLLTPTDLKPLGVMPTALTLDQAVLFAAEAVRRDSGVDVAFLGHTTFGDGLPAGPVSSVDLDAFVRFDGGFVSALVDGETLARTILPRTNQFGAFPYEQRVGDFLYASPIDPRPGKQYRIAVNAYVASAAVLMEAYFGTSSLKFSPVPDTKLKASVIGAMHSAEQLHHK
jgi:5'-nucleotidase/UDP-sugar diphosphatase